MSERSGWLNGLLPESLFTHYETGRCSESRINIFSVTILSDEVVSVVRGPLRGSNGLRIHNDPARDPIHISPNLVIGSALRTDNGRLKWNRAPELSKRDAQSAPFLFDQTKPEKTIWATVRSRPNPAAFRPFCFSPVDSEESRENPQRDDTQNKGPGR